MMPKHRILLLVVFMALPILAASFDAPWAQTPPPRADDDDDDAADHIRAFEALKSGKIVPISKILDWLERNYRGTVVEVELEADTTPMSYEVEYLSDDGNFLEFEFDATNGALARVKGAGAEKARKTQ